jgi:hypothetical protein
MDACEPLKMVPVVENQKRASYRRLGNARQNRTECVSGQLAKSIHSVPHRKRLATRAGAIIGPSF